VLIGVRYRHDLKALQDKWDREGNFVSGIGAIELNNGTIDHAGWEGSAEAMGGVLGSFERGPWSMMGYTVARANMPDHSGYKDGNSVFAGGGMAYTPREDLRTGRLVSYQVGLSWEHYARDRSADAVIGPSGGNEVFIHPALAYSPGHKVLIFGIVSVPVWQELRDPATRTTYRIGTGVIYGW
jgi:hypothetical protein